MIKTINREACKILRDVMNEALQEVAEKMGVKIEVGNASFTSSNITFKVSVATTNDDGTVNSKEAEAFKTYAFRWGLSPDDLNKTFVSGGKTYKITGASPRASRFPILAERVPDGKGFKFPADTVKRLLA